MDNFRASGAVAARRAERASATDRLSRPSPATKRALVLRRRARRAWRPPGSIAKNVFPDSSWIASPAEVSASGLSRRPGRRRRGRGDSPWPHARSPGPGQRLGAGTGERPPHGRQRDRAMGTKGQKDEWIPRMARRSAGRHRHYEPNVGSDAAAVDRRPCRRRRLHPQRQQALDHVRTNRRPIWCCRRPTPARRRSCCRAPHRPDRRADDRGTGAAATCWRDCISSTSA